jgi:hypothetical protein
MFLQQAVDHYPRLAAFHFSLRLPGPFCGDLQNRFQQDLRLCIDAFVNQRQSQGKPAPPTRVRMLWGIDHSGNTGVLLLLSQNTFHSVRHDKSLQHAQEDMAALISDVWGSVTGAGLLPSAITCLSVNRDQPEAFTTQSGNLSALVSRITCGGHQFTVW